MLWLRRQRVRGRTGFIWGFVVARIALPVATTATALRALTEPFRWGHFLAHVAANVGVAGGIGGYVAGRLAWSLLVAPRASHPSPAPPGGRGNGDSSRSRESPH
jgi:hypothetical protein